ncbi:hypothetical protein DOTSEDRAFT_67855 [Dothistroma septosporum NZE10]|uniref:Pkinase-domain-containing protein n=1 Tax=Dothistroma septosporum (strain NZE10 / CBS 128990) TaxID=675120 RepID=N1PZT5_DOTSN|nr:hypothetical protein DOTSEDRAFT_67855 [Dothistroma septosporum NZE10]
MDSDELTQQTQQCTQDVLDPRREGKNNSGLSTEDISDVMCIFHPGTPAAYHLANFTAQRAPQYILEDVDMSDEEPLPESATQDLEDDQKTFILSAGVDRPIQSYDFAFRFSTNTLQPALGIIFGRNPDWCDIIVSGDVHRRVSNMHFALYMNEAGVIMLQDTSTNGTMVDDILLKGKSGQHPTARMLNHGSVIQILSPSPEEAIKFIVRIPSRTGFHDQYLAKFDAYLARQVAAETAYRKAHGDETSPLKWRTSQSAGNSALRAPIVSNQYGMHWDGGTKFNVIAQIGKGAFASVYQLATKGEGHLYAAKELEKRRFMKNGILDRKLENEMNIMRQIDHKSIVAYHGYEDAPHHLYIIMEYVGRGDLQQHLAETGPLLEYTAKSMSTQVLDALDYLHKKNITHRDIKPDNILLEEREPHDFIIKLSDFGLSKVVDTNDTFLKTFCGTLLYCAPEVFPHYDGPLSKGVKRPRAPPKQHPSKQHTYSQAVDIWSYGAVLWYSLCHKPPFEGIADHTGRGMFDRIMMTPLDTSVFKKTSKPAIDLLIQMLNTDPATRPSAETCLEHEWFAGLPPPVHRPQQIEVLGAIAEEPEADAALGDDPDVAALSIHEKPSSQYSEVSLDSSDMNFFDPRQSKRFKVDHDEDGEEPIDSSPELYESIPIALQGNAEQQAQAVAEARPRPKKLFGEISQSDLQNRGYGQYVDQMRGDHSSSVYSDHVPESDGSRGGDPPSPQRHRGTSPSLYGAESMVREMNMDSAFAQISDGADPRTPASLGLLSDSDLSHKTPAASAPAAVVPERPRFSRQINVPLPPSYYWKADDPSTHTIEYAEKVSGRSFAAERMRLPRRLASPANGARRATTRQVDSQARATTNKLEGASKPALGRLVSTHDSFAQITIDLNKRWTRWGRTPTNEVAYDDQSELRVPKTAFGVFWSAPELHLVPEDGDITALPGLYCGLLTFASNGVHVNGVQLDKGELGRQRYGRLHNGDVIDIWPCASNKKDRLRFRCEFFVGEGKDRRPKEDPKFKVETEGRSRSTSRSTQGKIETAAAEITKSQTDEEKYDDELFSYDDMASLGDCESEIVDSF